VTVTVKESKLLSKKIILKWFDSKPAIPAFLRSFNLGWWWAPMWLKYKGKLWKSSYKISVARQ